MILPKLFAIRHSLNARFVSARSVLDVFALLVVFMIVFLPLVSLGAEPGQLVPADCNTTIVNGRFTNPCGWTHLLQLAQNLLNFMVYIAVPIAAIAFAYAGWLYLSARGNPGQITKAHGIFMNVAIGIVIVLVAWLVIDQIMEALVNPNSFIRVLTGA